MIKITVNDSYHTEAEKSPDGLLLNQLPFEADMIQIRENQFHIIHQNKSYEVEVVKADPAGKTFTFKINGKILRVAMRNEFDQLLEKMGMGNGSAGQVKDLKAPMPGLILTIAVNEGQAVKKGDPLLILEAMKMENVIKSPADGIVRGIRVKKGDNVEKNQVLILF